MTDVLARLGEIGVVPVVVIDDAQLAPALGAALVAGGLACAEVTLRTPAALDALAALAATTDLLVGAGTVVRPSQVEQVVQAGAQFVVSPGLSAAVVAECRSVGVPVLPGVATATEVMQALDSGIDIVKLFPAETVGGVGAVAALAGPFPDIRFVPTGGIKAERLEDYLRLPAVHAVGGSWLTPPDLLRRRDFGAIQARAAQAAQTVTAVRGAA
jgi:2-dehydro-3-deoxyphosphogluconate aldolase/(4S)-4-hydroxy-2-oxoglutarate aldolase